MYKPDKHDPENKILTRVYFEYNPLVNYIIISLFNIYNY